MDLPPERVEKAVDHKQGQPPAAELPSMPFRGRLFVLQAAIENERGRLIVDGRPWLISGPDCPSGTKVRVIGVDGARLKVVPAEADTTLDTSADQ